ncbi:hypothetical protein IAE22_29170, partial [Bacillus sp. S34]|nr:hypothetical protein [Bacillus sp. S34]
ATVGLVVGRGWTPLAIAAAIGAVVYFAGAVVAAAQDADFLLHQVDEDVFQLSVDETTTPDDVARLAGVFGAVDVTVPVHVRGGLAVADEQQSHGTTLRNTGDLTPGGCSSAGSSC